MPNPKNGAHQERLAKHLRDLLGRTPSAPIRRESAVLLEGAPGIAAAPVLDREELERHAESLLRGRAAPETVAMLETIILPTMRPVLDVVDGTFGAPRSGGVLGAQRC